MNRPPSPRSALALLVAVLLHAPAARAQVTFINRDDLAPHPSTNQIATRGQSPALSLHAAVVRFLPGKPGRPAPEFTNETTLASFASALAKQGQVNLLYAGDRLAPGGTNNTASFDSVERRPAFSTHTNLNPTLTGREFGLRLRVTARPLVDGTTELRWDGRFKWSPDLLNAWVGEKYLVFGMHVSQLLRPGLFYYQSADPDEDAPTGLNLRALFGKKKEPPPKPAVPDISFLSVEDREVQFTGQRTVRPGELIVVATSTSLDPKQPEFIYLLVRFDEAD